MTHEEKTGRAAADNQKEREGAEMTIRELNREQLITVKQLYYATKKEKAGGDVSWEELKRADYLISDEEIFEAYKDTEFKPGDFGE